MNIHLLEMPEKLLGVTFVYVVYSRGALDAYNSLVRWREGLAWTGGLFWCCREGSRIRRRRGG